MKAKIKKGKIVLIPETTKEKDKLRKYFDNYSYCPHCGGVKVINVKWNKP